MTPANKKKEISNINKTVYRCNGFLNIVFHKLELRHKAMQKAAQDVKQKFYLMVIMPAWCKVVLLKYTICFQIKTKN